MKVHWLQIHKQVKSGSIVWFSVFTAWQTAKVSTPSHQFTVHHLTSLQEVHNICPLEMGYETPREWFSIYRELTWLICTTLICEIQLLHGWSSERQDQGSLKEVKKKKPLLCGSQLNACNQKICTAKIKKCTKLHESSYSTTFQRKTGRRKPLL